MHWLFGAILDKLFKYEKKVVVVAVTETVLVVVMEGTKQLELTWWKADNFSFYFMAHIITTA